jgi:hypothetical protein
MDSDSDSSSDSNSDSDSDDSEVFHSVLNVLNEEDRAELAEYDRQMAEAWRIHDKYRGDPTKEYSDSELSVLASRQFNGMESIEMGGASEVHGIASSHTTVFGGDSEEKVSRYSRVLLNG